MTLEPPEMIEVAPPQPRPWRRDRLTMPCGIAVVVGWVLLCGAVLGVGVSGKKPDGGALGAMFFFLGAIAFSLVVGVVPLRFSRRSILLPWFGWWRRTR